MKDLQIQSRRLANSQEPTAKSTPRRAFTLIELIVIIGLIGLLIAILLPSLRGVRGAAKNTDSLNSLKQLSLAYKSYMEDNNYRLMPGYLDEPTRAFLNITAKLPNGTLLNRFDATSGLCDSGSYVWRLAPYLGDTWKVLFTDIREPALISQLSAEYGLGQPTDAYGPGSIGAGQIGISEHPAYGLNSIFLGGDTVHGGVDVVPQNPWAGAAFSAPLITIAATRFSQVRNPSKIILFAPTAPASNSGDLTIAYDNPDIGYAELRPPYTVRPPTAAGMWTNIQWYVSTNAQVARHMDGDYAAGAGLPIARGGVSDRLPVAHLDGSASIERLSEISTDMTRWDPLELTPEAVQIPVP
jgi:type II secretory pathway pseudopilin PulG